MEYLLFGMDSSREISVIGDLSSCFLLQKMRQKCR